MELPTEILYGYPYKAGIPKGTDTAGKPNRHNRAVGAECGGCRKASAAHGGKNEPKPNVLDGNSYNAADKNLKSCNMQKDIFTE